jgi:hypothetical protein
MDLFSSSTKFFGNLQHSVRAQDRGICQPRVSEGLQISAVSRACSGRRMKDKDSFRPDEEVRIKNKIFTSPSHCSQRLLSRQLHLGAMMGFAHNYGRDNGTDSDAGPDGNGEADIPSYGTQFEKRKLQIEEESEHEEGSVAHDSLDENQSGKDQDLVDPGEAVHERLTQDFLMQASAEYSQTPIGKVWNCRSGRRSSRFRCFRGFL